ncbi:MAG: hypothetical protein WC749_08545 [Dehalococcoidia bacterium]
MSPFKIFPADPHKSVISNSHIYVDHHVSGTRPSLPPQIHRDNGLLIPPLTLTIWPVTQQDRSEARKSAIFATSCGLTTMTQWANGGDLLLRLMAKSTFISFPSNIARICRL